MELGSSFRVKYPLMGTANRELRQWRHPLHPRLGLGAQLHVPGHRQVIGQRFTQRPRLASIWAAAQRRHLPAPCPPLQPFHLAILDEDSVDLEQLV